MTLYARFDCAMARDPKMLRAGPMARLLYIQAVMHCREDLTDGFIDRLVLPAVAVDIPQAARHMNRLVEVGAVVETEHGWRIPEHAWRRWNPTRSEVEDERERKREAGELGNHERWHAATGKRDPKCRICIAQRSQNNRTLRGPSETGAMELPSPEPEPEPEPSLLDRSNGSSARASVQTPSVGSPRGTLDRSEPW